jgi:hypothetical protein
MPTGTSAENRRPLAAKITPGNASANPISNDPPAYATRIRVSLSRQGQSPGSIARCSQ